MENNIDFTNKSWEEFNDSTDPNKGGFMFISHFPQDVPFFKKVHEINDEEYQKAMFLKAYLDQSFYNYTKRPTNVLYTSALAANILRKLKDYDTKESFKLDILDFGEVEPDKYYTDERRETT